MLEFCPVLSWCLPLGWRIGNEVQATLRPLSFFSGPVTSPTLMVPEDGASTGADGPVGIHGQLRSEKRQKRKRRKLRGSLSCGVCLLWSYYSLQSFLFVSWVVFLRQDFAMRPRLASDSRPSS